MVNEVEKHIKESGPSTPISLSPDIENAGVVNEHEDEKHRQIVAALNEAPPEASVSKDAVPPATEPTGLVQMLEPNVKGGSFRNTFGWLGLFNRRKNEQAQRKGGIKNAA